LLRVIVNLADSVDVELRVGGNRILERLEGRGRIEVDGGGLKNVGRAQQDLVEDFGVAPDFGVEGRAARIEDADDLPVAPAKIDGIADGQPGIGFGSVFPDDELR